MDSSERKRLAAEVSAQHGIRIDPDDPIMAVVTLNRLFLDNVLDEAMRSIQNATDEFRQSAERVQVRAGSAVAQEVRECTAAIRQELQKDINEARLNARELTDDFRRTQLQRWAVPWVAIGIACGAVLFAAGFCLSLLLR